MPEIDIVLVAPIYEGNVGFCCPGDEEFRVLPARAHRPLPARQGGKRPGIACAGRAAAAETCTIEDVFARSNIVIATTGTVSKSVCHAMRMPFYSPKELRERVKDADGRISILFGRENWGLNNEEVKRSDMICTIPTHGDVPDPQPLARGRGGLLRTLEPAAAGDSGLPRRRTWDTCTATSTGISTTIHHPKFKRENTMILIRRILGRANLTTREASTLHGLLRRSEWHIDPSLLDRDKTGIRNLEDGHDSEPDLQDH